MDSTKFGNIVWGLIQSWSAWLGVVIVSMPDWWPLIATQVAELVGQDAASKLVRVMGILVILARFKTSKSLEEKGRTI